VCEIIRSTEKGNLNCIKSDKILGEKAKALMKPTYGQCLSCGFVDASAPILVGGKHIANWLIGQSNVMGVDKNRIDIEIRGDEEFCEVRIADHGAGIPDEIKETMFEENFLVLTFSVVDSSSPPTRCSNRGRHSFVFASLRLCDFALNGRKDWKPQNPIESENFVHGETGNTGLGLYITRKAM